MSIKVYIDEIKRIDTHISELKKEIKLLTKRRQECEEFVIEYLDENKFPGVKYDGSIIEAKYLNRKKRLNKKQKMENGLHALRRLGFNGDDDAIQVILDAMRGEEESKRVLRFASESR